MKELDSNMSDTLNSKEVAEYLADLFRKIHPGYKFTSKASSSNHWMVEVSYRFILAESTFWVAYCDYGDHIWMVRNSNSNVNKIDLLNEESIIETIKEVNIEWWIETYKRRKRQGR